MVADACSQTRKYQFTARVSKLYQGKLLRKPRKRFALARFVQSAISQSQKILQSILSHPPDNKEFIPICQKACGGARLPVRLSGVAAEPPRDLFILNELATLYGKIDAKMNSLLTSCSATDR
jgi:hypothetical protein